MKQVPDDATESKESRSVCGCSSAWRRARGVGRVVRSGGRIVIAVQPRRRGADESDSERWAERLQGAGQDSHLKVIELVRGATTPSTVAAVLEKP